MATAHAMLALQRAMKEEASTRRAYIEQGRAEAQAVDALRQAKAVARATAAVWPVLD